MTKRSGSYHPAQQAKKEKKTRSALLFENRIVTGPHMETLKSAMRSAKDSYHKVSQQSNHFWAHLQAKFPIQSIFGKGNNQWHHPNQVNAILLHHFPFHLTRKTFPLVSLRSRSIRNRMMRMKKATPKAPRRRRDGFVSYPLPGPVDIP